MMRWIPFVAFVAACLVSCLSAAGQIGNASHSDKTRKFTAKAPQRWYRTPDLIDPANEYFDFVNPWRTSTVTQVWQRSSTPELTYPYVVLEVTELDVAPLSYANIEKAFDAQTRSDKAAALGQPMAKMVTQLPDGEVLLDRSRNRLIEKSSERDEDGTSVTELSVGFLGKSNVVFLTLTCDEKKLETYLPEFQEFVDGFQWESGGAYTPPAGAGAGTPWTANRSDAQVAQREAEANKAGRANRASGGGGGGSTATPTMRFGRSRGVFGGIGLVVIVVLGLLVRWMIRD
jgi:hypothetical protein